MNAFVKKEIRSLLPAWIAILVLDSVLPWFYNQPDVTFVILPAFFFLGMVILAIDCFGREFSSGTFSLLLTQPMERKQIWWTKMAVLFSAVAFISIIYTASCWLRTHLAFANDHWVWASYNVFATWKMVRFSIFVCVMAVLLALSGALWTTLLFRQVSTAFWIALLTPAGLATVLSFFIPAKTSNDAFAIIFTITACIYSIVGFWLARKLFYRAQDVGWTGGIIAFSRWRYFESSAGLIETVRRQRPIRALFRKEFQLHSIALIGAGVLLGMHIAVFVLRGLYADEHKNSIAAVISDFFWVLWLVMPLLIGCMAVAEERKLDVMDEQFCQPVSRRVQFLIKFLPTMFFGIFFGGIMPLLLEGIVAHIGLPNEIFTRQMHSGNYFNFLADPLFWFKFDVVALSAGFSLAAFFGSTLARNFLHALSIAIVTIVGCILFVGFLGWVSHEQPIIFGIIPWHSVLPIPVALLVVPIALIWLAYLNFNHFQESKRLWRRNAIGISSALLFVIVSSALIYNRAWEMFEPVEPSHGAAKFSAAEMPELRSGIYESYSVRFPDGRIWCDNLSEWFYEEHPSFNGFLHIFFRPLPKSVGPQKFIGGENSSNWLDAASARIDLSEVRKFGYLDTVGLKNDGMLWISEKSEPQVWPGAKMIRFGDASDWRQLVQIYHGFLLLKKDNTLWYWGPGTNRISYDRKNWPTVRVFQPERIGTNANWKEISPVSWMRCARKSDGTVWQVDGFSKDTAKLSHETNWDEVNLQTFSQGGNASAYVGEDGTLWICNRHYNSKYDWLGAGYLRVGNETNWQAVSVNEVSMIALKSDGTLWKWNVADSPRDIAKIPPTRLDIHNDWISLISTWGGAVSLATDGSLWLWPGDSYEGALLKIPKQPQFLGNVFGKAN